jgi:hypothetical protein
MKIKIYAIGGNLNDKYVGTATDSTTFLSLLDLIEQAGGYACSVHGPGLLDWQVSGEVLLNEARKMLDENYVCNK